MILPLHHCHSKINLAQARCKILACDAENANKESGGCERHRLRDDGCLPLCRCRVLHQGRFEGKQRPIADGAARSYGRRNVDCRTFTPGLARFGIVPQGVIVVHIEA